LNLKDSKDTFKMLEAEVSIEKGAKAKAGSQKQEPQSPTPGILPSNSIPNFNRIL
jgi:hypothetical protein